MSRRIINENTTELQNNIFNDYALIKPELDYYKKKESELKDSIKKYCIENNTFEHSACANNKNYKISISVTEKNDLDTNKLLETIIKMYGQELLLEWGVIENKIVLNEEKLQEQIFSKVINGSILQDCIIEKEPTYTLRIKEVK